VGEVGAVLGAAVFEGARRAGEAVGEAQAESLLGDVGEAVVGVAGDRAGQMWVRQAVAWRTAAAC